MEKILDMMGQELKQAFAACRYEGELAKVILSNRPDLCEYQCNGTMAAAEAYKKKPIDIVSVVTEKLVGGSGHPVFKEAVAAMLGFINLKLSEQFLPGYVNGMAAGDKLGLEAPERLKTIMVDHEGANVAEPLHVGRLRVAIVGENIKRMGRFLGHEMTDGVHLGDQGLQMGLIIEESRNRKPEPVYFDQTYTGEFPSQAPLTISELEEIYPAASAKPREDETFKERTHEATLKLQEGYPPHRAIWQYITAVPVEDLKKNYSNPNVEFDLWKDKNDAEPYIRDMIQMLIDKGLAYESWGALVVDVAEESNSKEISPCLIHKSDRASLYTTSDLVTIVRREQDFHPDRYIYVVGKRQGIYFEQVFRAAKKAGIVAQGTLMVFLRFGTMNGKDKRPLETRRGEVTRLEKPTDETDDAVYARIMENRTMSREEARTTSKIAGLAALKYGDLSNRADKGYVFDTRWFTSFEGNTGPYILYTIVRTKSILFKYRGNGGSASEQALERHILPPYGKPERVLMLMLSKYNEVLENSFAETVPYKICQYIYELANAFNSFYHDTKILSEEGEARRGSYIGLTTLTKWVLETCIGLLGVEVPDRMQMTAEREHQSNEDYQDECQQLLERRG